MTWLFCICEINTLLSALVPRIITSLTLIIMTVGCCGLLVDAQWYNWHKPPLSEHKGIVCGFVFLRYSLRFCALDYHGNKIEIGIIFCEKFQYLNDII